jgi:large subunit ribosomal protein L15
MADDERFIGLHNLKPAKGSTHRRKRVGRGEGSGVGKTSGRGQKGAGARAGSKSRVAFEGGQNPIQRRVPKRGFVNIHRAEIHGVNVGRLEGAFKAGEQVTVDSLHAKGLVPKRAKLIKLLGEGDLNTALTIQLHGVSESAKQKIEAAGGSVQLIVKPEPDAA